MRRPVIFVFLFCSNIAACLACIARERLTVKLFDEAGAGHSVLSRARAEAEWLLKSVCVDTAWVSCPVVTVANMTLCPAPANAVEVHILASPLTKDVSAKAMGLAIPRIGTGGRASVFLSRVRRTVESEPDTIDVARLLGHVIAHEIGHLLIRSSEHATEGLMRADFRSQDLKKAAQRRLGFTLEQASAIQNRFVGTGVARR